MLSLFRAHRGMQGFDEIQAELLSLDSVHPETPDGHSVVFDLETSNFSQGQGNQAFERRRSRLRRTIKCAD
jgi:hypothetical protein